MSPRATMKLAAHLRRSISQHARVVADDDSTYDEQQRAQCDRDLALQRAAYLIQHLDGRHAATMLAQRLGLPVRAGGAA